MDIGNFFDDTGLFHDSLGISDHFEVDDIPLSQIKIRIDDLQTTLGSEFKDKFSAAK